MSELRTDSPSPFVRFPNFADIGDLNALSVVVQDLSVIYDIATVAALPGYEEVILPGMRLGPRRRSPLRAEDRLKLQKVSLASPLEIVFAIASAAAVVGLIATNVSRIQTAIVGYFNVLSAATDYRQRVQALEENRDLAPERLREARLRNEILAQRLRIVSADADVVERAHAEVRDPSVPSFSPSHRPSARRQYAFEATSEDIAALLDEPMQRLIGYGGGEMEFGGEYAAEDESDED